MTRDRVAEMPREEFIAGNRAISKIVEDAVRRIGARGFFLPSSGAVYRKDRSIDDDMEHNPYGVLKYQDELKFRNIFKDTGTPLAIGRIFNLAGPFVNKLNTYALSSIITQLQRGAPIEIRAAHKVIRSYVHVGDVLDIAFSCLTAPQNENLTVCFDTRGDEAVELGELALRAAKLLGRPNCKIVRPPLDDARVDAYLGDGASFAKLLDTYGIWSKPLDRQILDTASFLAQQ